MSQLKGTAKGAARLADCADGNTRHVITTRRKSDCGFAQVQAVCLELRVGLLLAMGLEPLRLQMLPALTSCVASVQSANETRRCDGPEHPHGYSADPESYIPGSVNLQHVFSAA